MLFGRIFAKFEDLGVVQVGDQILRLFAELDLLRLAQVLKEGFLMLLVLKLLGQLLDLVLTCCVTRVEFGMGAFQLLSRACSRDET